MGDVFAVVAACMADISELDQSERDLAFDALFAASGRNAPVVRSASPPPRKPVPVPVHHVPRVKVASPKGRENPGRYPMQPETAAAVQKVLDVLRSHPAGMKGGDMAREAGLDPKGKDYANARVILVRQGLAQCSAQNRSGVWTLVRKT